MSSQFEIPQIKGYDQAYLLSYQLAWDRLKATADISQQCDHAGAKLHYNSGQSLILMDYLGKEHELRPGNYEIKRIGDNEPVALKDQLLLLHYFNTAKGTPKTNRLITFRELPAGPVYFPTFTRRVTDPITRKFGNMPGQLIVAAETMGGKKGDFGDASVVIQAFPRVEIIIVVWQGDDELPPQGNILFDANVSDYLPTEDITVLSETIAWKLVRYQG
jgi:hypothetical protein